MKMLASKWKVSAALTSLLALAAVAAAPGAWARAAPPLPVTIVLHDHGFSFRNIGFRATRVKLDVKNDGQHKHALAILGTGPSDALEIITPVLKPGASTYLTLKLPPGPYKIFSPVDHDRAHGFVAQMRYTEPSPAGSDGAEMDRVFYNY
ncbi:MAG TPA: cupredoxin domain-containing protein [Gammaproteobacteria bacterium]|nr:cupredoxin domain-containing protein [Gammaproteobacteria bacterium]